MRLTNNPPSFYKTFILTTFLALIMAGSAFGQEQTVTITTTGNGKTQDEAKQIALRNAIEEAFGTFISSNTEILNDDLVKDEIVSVSNGNIQQFEVLSAVQIPDGSYATSLKVTVSVSKLTSFIESKGISVEFAGSLFAFNILQQKLNEQNEIKAIEDLTQVIQSIADVSFDYKITASDPISVDAGNSLWRIPITISAYKNSNFDNIPNILYSTLNGLSLTLNEAHNYMSLGKKVYPVSFSVNENKYSYMLFRREESIKLILSIVYYFNQSITNFYVESGVDKFRINTINTNDLNIKDDNFRLLVSKIGRCRSRDTYIPGSIFFDFTGNANGRNVVNATILDWTKWSNIRREWRGCGYGWMYNLIGYDYRAYATTYPHDGFFDNNFTFVNEISNKFINSESGLVISFGEKNPNLGGAEKNRRFSSNRFRGNNNVVVTEPVLKEPVVIFTFNDIRTLDEIRNISEYKVSPIKN